MLFLHSIVTRRSMQATPESIKKFTQENVKKLVQDDVGLNRLRQVVVIGSNDWAGIATSTMTYEYFMQVANNIAHYAGYIFVFDNFEALASCDITVHDGIKQIISILCRSNTIHVISSNLDVMQKATPMHALSRIFYYYYDKHDGACHYRSFKLLNAFIAHVKKMSKV